MLWITLAATAPATTTGGGASTCAPPFATGFWPEDGGVVAPDAVLYGLQEATGCGSVQWRLHLEGAYEDVIPAQEFVSSSVVALHPPEPLAEGTWTASDPYGEFVVEFEVVAGTPAPEPPGEGTAEVEAVTICDGPASLDLTAMVALASPGVGLVELSWRSENGEQDTSTWFVTGGTTAFEDRRIVLGQREACVGVTVTDLDGAVVSSTEACAPDVEPCAAGDLEGEGEEEGCGCASTSGGVGPALVTLGGLAAVALRRRR